MKKTWKFVVAVLFLLGLLLLYHVYRSYSPIDGFQGFLWRTFAGEDTMYAPGYTDRGFIQVTEGMSHDQVYRLLGPPLNIWTNQDTSISERWSKSPSDSNFRCRVLFFTNNVVAKKHSEFYED